MSASSDLPSDATREEPLDERRPHVAPWWNEDSSTSISSSELIHDENSNAPVVLIAAECSQRQTCLRRRVEASYATYRIKCVQPSRKALQKARHLAPVLIVAEVQMQELSGFELCEMLSKDSSLRGTAVLLLANEEGPTARTAGLRAGADAVLTAPVDPALFAAQVDALCSQRRRYRDRILEQGRKRKDGTEERFVRRAREAVKQHIDAPEFGPQELADAVALSYVQCYRRLRNEVEKTPSRFIRSVRLEHAAELLRNGAESIQSVASAVGFNSASYFTRCFHEEMGQTPSSYQQEATVA